MTLFKILNVRLPMARSERVTLSIKKDLHTCEVCSAFGSDQKASALFHMPGGSDNMADDHEQSMRD